MQWYSQPTNNEDDGFLLFLIIGDMHEELLCDLVPAELVIHRHQQLLGLGVHIAHLHSSFMVEKDMVALTCGIDAHIELFLLVWAGQRS